MSEAIYITECPRDAMQGLKQFIPTRDKVRYIQALLEVGYEIVDFGSFVSPKAIPQMRDSAEVVRQLDLSRTTTKLLAIIANLRGAAQAVQFEQIHYLGFPFSVSETFQIRNTNATMEESIERVLDIHALCEQSDKELVVYLSMAFGNPYGDPWNLKSVVRWIEYFIQAGIRRFALSDTIGVANPDSIVYLFTGLTEEYPHCTFGAHFHTRPDNWYDNVKAAYDSGCRHFDAAIGGFGGCPMAKDELTGNLPTEHLLEFCHRAIIPCSIDEEAFIRAVEIAREIFPNRPLHHVALP